MIQLPEIKGLFTFPISLHSAFDEIPLGLVILDQDRRIIFINRAMEGITGFSLKKAIGVPCYHILRSKVCIQACPVHNKMNKENGSVCVESDLINCDRQLIPVRITIGPLKDFEENVVGYLETVEDLRSLGESEEVKTSAYSYGNIIGKSLQMEKLFRILPVIAQSDSSVLITGETGTGKDLVAEAIHQASDRARGPFIKINCGALPESLLESEIFGHQKGAFTGAIENKPGRFRLAHNGTLYLTEIGDLPLSLQVKLLTFLDDKIVYPLGSTKGFQVNVRVIAATHRDLEQMVRRGQFREDLFFRLLVVHLHLPPLREREGDIRLLIDHFLNLFATQFGKNIKGYSSKALQILLDYSYPGNIRELRNIVEYAVNICIGTRIHPKHLPSYLTEVKLGILEKGNVGEKDEASVRTILGTHDGKEFRQTWPSMERKMILEALVKARGRRSKAAELLGWGRSTLWRKMKQYGMGN